MIVKKTLYSLMLSDDVIREIDLLAHRKGTNRSNLVNQILAEHVQMRTPEQRVGDVFSAIEELMSATQIIPQLTAGAPYMALRSCLEYKYRPTVRYEVEIFPNVRSGTIGNLSVVYRTQSSALLNVLTSFFDLWSRIEKKYFPINIDYMLEDGRFVRSICYPTSRSEENSELTSRELAELISDYIRLFDKALKGYVSGELTPEGVLNEYTTAIKGKNILI